MAKIERTVTINAPVEKIFNYVNDSSNLLEIWPSLVEVKDVQWLPNGGTRLRFVYEMAGMRFEGTSEDIECVANQRIVNKTGGGIESTMTWKFQRGGGGTEVTLEAEYTVPIPLVGKLAAIVIAKINERDLVTLLAGLKIKMTGVEAKVLTKTDG